jgi:hypothetical protein
LLPRQTALIVAPIEAAHFKQEYSIMNVNTVLTRFAQMALAVTIVLAEGVVFRIGVV